MGLIRKQFYLVILVPFSYILFQNYWNISLFSLNEFNMFSNVIFYSGITLAVLSAWTSSQRTSISYLQLVVYLLFLPFVILFISTTNLLVFFMCYEFFLLPSFFIVFFGSPNRRGVLASIYFLMWTQVGSFLVFISIILIFLKNNTFLFESISFMNTLPVILALIGFGIKIPIWPAHYWLTKTHVEAPTYFSIYLSGFLVKTALYGIWIFATHANTFNFTILFAIAVIGVIDSSIKMWAQVDLKKLVAYGTIQEMNLILIGFSLATSSIIKAVSLFILAHTILSTIFFLFADSLYRRFNSRSTTSVRGLLQNYPFLGYTLFICCLFFAGLPFTLKFIVEVFIFLQVFNVNGVVAALLLIICNWFGIISFMKNWFVSLFGSSTFKQQLDISTRELCVYAILCILLIILSLLSFYII